MRKITQEAKIAWDTDRHFRKSKTTVKLGGLYIFGNKIASKVWRSKNGRRDHKSFVEFNMRGWNTVTTRERLKAVGVTIVQRKGEPYFVQPNGELVPISEYCYYLVNEYGYLKEDE